MGIRAFQKYGLRSEKFNFVLNVKIKAIIFRLGQTDQFSEHNYQGIGIRQLTLQLIGKNYLDRFHFQFK